MMKHLLRLTLFAAIVLTAASCDRKSETTEVLDVTAHNVSGVWQLVEWSGGSLAEGTYVYMELTRRDREFTIYDNLTSFSARCRTGRYNIVIDEDYGTAVIRGQYNYGTGDWQHRYKVTGLTATGMTWTAVDDPDDVSVYRRCDAVPQYILDELPAKKE